MCIHWEHQKEPHQRLAARLFLFSFSYVLFVYGNLLIALLVKTYLVDIRRPEDVQMGLRHLSRTP